MVAFLHARDRLKSGRVFEPRICARLRACDASLSRICLETPETVAAASDSPTCVCQPCSLGVLGLVASTGHPRHHAMGSVNESLLLYSNGCCIRCTYPLCEFERAQKQGADREYGGGRRGQFGRSCRPAFVSPCGRRKGRAPTKKMATAQWPGRGSALLAAPHAPSRRRVGLVPRREVLNVVKRLHLAEVLLQVASWSLWCS